MLKKNPIEISLGIDAEWLIMDGRKLIIEPVKDGKEHFSADGVTGANKVSEIRTKPFICPLKVINNIREIFQEQVDKKPHFFNYRWVCGSYIRNRSLGLHNHFKIDKKVLNHSVAAQFLDEYVGSLSILIENKEQGINRRKNYGFLRDFREQKLYNGVEYRVYGSTLNSPHATAAILALGKTVLYEVINNPSFKFNFHNFTYDDFAFANIHKIRSKFPAIWKDIEKMSLYPKYKKQIDFLAFLIRNKLTWQKRNPDIKAAWGIIKPISAPKPFNFINANGETVNNPLPDWIVDNLPQYKEEPDNTL